MRRLTGLFMIAIMVGGVSANAQTPDKPIKIGVLEDMSGPLSDSSGIGSVAAVQLAVDDFGGRVLGREISVVSADHQNKADVAVGIARHWFDREDVSMILGLSNSSVALAVQELAREKNKIDIVSSAGSSDLTNKHCSPNGIHWTYDTYALSAATAKSLINDGGNTWFFVTADYAFGKALESDTTAAVQQLGGKVVGSVRFPFGASDFASYLVAAQASQAKVVAFASAGGDTTNLIKQSAEFGLNRGGQLTTGLLVLSTDIYSLGQAAAGIKYATSYSMDANDASQKWAKHFATRYDKPATMAHAGAYTATMHYLKAIEAAKTSNTADVLKMMHQMKINDFMVTGGEIRDDGRVLRDMWLVEAKKPADMREKYDLERVLARIPGNETVRPLQLSECPLVKK